MFKYENPFRKTIENTKPFEKIVPEAPKEEIKPIKKRDKDKIRNERNAFLRNAFKDALGRDLTPEEFDEYIELYENNKISFWGYVRKLNGTVNDE